jgi:hypothetical protein
MSQRLSSEHGGLSNRALRSLLAAVEDMLAVRLTLRVMEYQDQELICIECKQPFHFTASGQAFVAEQGYAPPKLSD